MITSAPERALWTTRCSSHSCVSFSFSLQSGVRGRGDVVVSVLDFRYGGWRFNAQSLPSRCLCRHETLPHIVSLHPDVIMCSGDVLLGVTLQWTSILSRGSSNTFSRFMLKKLGLAPARVSLFGSCATLPTRVG